MTHSSDIRAMFDDTIIPFPLRPDVVVKIHGIPPDMTEQEAERLAKFIKAFAKPKQDNSK